MIAAFTEISDHAISDLQFLLLLTVTTQFNILLIAFKYTKVLVVCLKPRFIQRIVELIIHFNQNIFNFFFINSK